MTDNLLHVSTNSDISSIYVNSAQTMSQSIGQTIRKFINSRVARTGLPFVAFVIGGSFFLKHFTSLRYEFRKGKKLTEEEMQSMGLQPKDVNIVKNKMLQDIEEGKVDQWENIRGPRPWEDSKTYQTEARLKIEQAKGSS